MRIDELRKLFENSIATIDELRAKYESGQILTRRDCLEMQQCNARLHLIGRELLLLDGSDDPAFDCFRQPHVKQPLPRSMEPIDLTERSSTEIH